MKPTIVKLIFAPAAVSLLLLIALMIKMSVDEMSKGIYSFDTFFVSASFTLLSVSLLAFMWGLSKEI
jgi:hypothetical protein